jgi:hypothetical protein
VDEELDEFVIRCLSKDPDRRYADTADLAREVCRTGLVATLSASTVWRWLHQDAIRPWQHRCWIFPRDSQFASTAAGVVAVENTIALRLLPNLNLDRFEVAHLLNIRHEGWLCRKNARNSVLPRNPCRCPWAESHSILSTVQVGSSAQPVTS